MIATPACGGVAYLSQLEDSSAGYGDDWGTGGPIYRACHAAVVQFIRECLEDQLPDLFGPGASPAPKKPPHLTLHLFNAAANGAAAERS